MSEPDILADHIANPRNQGVLAEKSGVGAARGSYAAGKNKQRFFLEEHDAPGSCKKRGFASCKLSKLNPDAACERNR